MEIFVIDKGGRSIPGYGWRAFGESFDLPDELAAEYVKTEFFSDKAPKPEKPSLGIVSKPQNVSTDTNRAAPTNESDDIA